MIYKGLVIEGPLSGSMHSSNSRLSTIDGFMMHIVDFGDGRGFWTKFDAKVTRSTHQLRALDILSSREWLEVAYKKGFADAADYENLNRVSDEDLEEVAEANWRMFKEN